MSERSLNILTRAFSRAPVTADPELRLWATHRETSCKQMVFQFIHTVGPIYVNYYVTYSAVNSEKKQGCCLFSFIISESHIFAAKMLVLVYSRLLDYSQ